MNVKFKIGGGIAIVVLGLGAVFGYNYLFPNDPLEMTEHDTSDLVVEDSLQTTTTSGIEVASIDGLIGLYAVLQDSSELFFLNGEDAGTSGKFKEFSVELQGDGSLEGMSVTTTINSASLYTFNDLRDEHLQKPEFFNTENYPEIAFTSTSVELGDTSYLAKGVINFLGKDVESTLPFNYVGKGEYEDGTVYHVIQGKFYMNLADFGMDVGATIAESATVTFYLEMVQEVPGVA